MTTEAGKTMLRIKRQEPEAVTLDVGEFAEFVERARHACSVALGDLLALGMPSPATSTGRLLLEVLRDTQAVLAELNVREEEP